MRRNPGTATPIIIVKQVETVGVNTAIVRGNGGLTHRCGNCELVWFCAGLQDCACEGWDG